MHRYLLDTDIASYFLKKRSPLVQERVHVAIRKGKVAVSVITRAELRYGLAFLADDHPLQRLVRDFLGLVPVLPWDEAAADHYARLAAIQRRSGQPIGILDTQIAAHALAEDLTLVSNNTADFGRIPGLRLENWAAA